MNIKIKNIISISEARSKIFEIAEKVQKFGQVFTFTENGKPKVVMISAEEYENLVEDLELMKDHKFMAKVRKVEEDFAKGEYVSWENIKNELLIKSGSLILKDEPKKSCVGNNDVKTMIRKKGNKKDKKLKN